MEFRVPAPEQEHVAIAQPLVEPLRDSASASPNLDGELTCPVCWLRFDPGDLMHIAVHEWADYIALTPSRNGGTIKFLHCKDDSETVGASSFHEVVAQAIKNLGRTQVTPNDLITKVMTLQTKRVWTSTVPIARYRGPGNPEQAAQRLIADPLTQKEVILVVTMLSEQAFKDEKDRNPLEPHFIQLVCAAGGLHAYMSRNGS